MGVQYPLPGVTFNRSIGIEARPERLSSDGGALLLREMGDKLGLSDWLASNLHDPRDPDLVTHPFAELLRTSLLQDLRDLKRTADGRSPLCQRIAVEHGLAHFTARQGPKARYRGIRKNILDARRTAVIVNLHTLLRMEDRMAA